MKKINTTAAVLGFIGVALGAFGAHALKARLAAAGMTATWETAVLYHLVHAVAAWAAGLAGAATHRPLITRAATSWIVGVSLFSGSLYLLALGGPRWLGPITPLGGVFLLLGWGLAAGAAMQKAE